MMSTKILKIPTLKKDNKGLIAFDEMIVEKDS